MKEFHMWSWQTAWWDQLAAWGMLAEDWRLGESPVFLFGTVLGAFAGAILVFLVWTGEVVSLPNVRYEGNWLSRNGKRMSVITGSIAVAAATVLLGMNFGVLLLATIATYPLALAVGALVLGPIMMLLGKVSWRKPSLPRIRKKKSAVEQSDSSQDEIMNENFHTVEFNGEEILMPK